MLDMAEAFTDWLLQHQPALAESQAETLGLLIAEQKDTVQHILRTSKLPDVSAGATKPEAVADNGADEQVEEPAAKKVRPVKAA